MTRKEVDKAFKDMGEAISNLQRELLEVATKAAAEIGDLTVKVNQLEKEVNQLKGINSPLGSGG